MTLLCQNGWPLLQPGSSKLHTWTIPARNGVDRVTVRNGSVGFLLVHNMLRISELVEDLTMHDPHGKLIVDDWGYAKRAVRGQTTGYSNHGGYAVDGNATRHPLGRSHTFSAKQIKQIHYTLSLYKAPNGEHVIRWGGDYHGRKDEMHWEINESISMAQCESVAKKLLDSYRGKRILDANPGQKRVILS